MHTHTRTHTHTLAPSLYAHPLTVLGDLTFGEGDAHARLWVQGLLLSFHVQALGILPDDQHVQRAIWRGGWEWGQWWWLEG